jgi:hypothetical protein
MTPRGGDGPPWHSVPLAPREPVTLGAVHLVTESAEAFNDLNQETRASDWSRVIGTQSNGSPDALPVGRLLA